MLLVLSLIATSLLLFQSEDTTAPQINTEPNHNALTTVLSFPSAKVNGPVRLPDKDVGHVYQLGPTITPPRPEHTPPPESVEKDRKAKHTGTVVIRVVVGTDGKIHDARVVRGLGMGLDEKALEAVKQWVFKPATKDGHNVAVYVLIEVNFKLY